MVKSIQVIYIWIPVTSPQLLNHLGIWENVYTCCCCTSVGFGCQGPSANAGSDSHSTLPAREGLRAALSPYLPSRSCLRSSKDLSLLLRSLPRPPVRLCKVSLGAGFCSAGSPQPCNSQVGMQTLAMGGSRSTPVLVQRATMSCV